MSSEEEARRFFDAIASRYDRAYAMPRDASRARVARVLAELAPSSRVLDLGVGTGRELAALLDAGHAPTGLDFSPEMLALCNRRARPIPLVQASFWEPLPFEGGAFDAAIALHGTLGHPPSDEALAELASEVARVLARPGVFAFEVPARGWLDDIDRAPPDMPDRRARRVGPDRFVHEDTIVGASIEARVIEPGAWRAILAPHFDARVEPIGAHEILVVARTR
jgi:SAM-dependent methyltransferase